MGQNDRQSVLRLEFIQAYINDRWDILSISVHLRDQKNQSKYIKHDRHQKRKQQFSDKEDVWKEQEEGERLKMTF